MKKRLFWLLGATIAVLIVVIVAFAMKTTSQQTSPAESESAQETSASQEAETESPSDATPLQALDMYKSVLLEERYKADCSYGFGEDCYFLLWDVDQDGETELLITGPIGMDSLYGTMVYDYDNNALSFTDQAGELIMVGAGALGIDGWYAEGEEGETTIYLVSNGAELSEVAEPGDTVAYNWQLILYADYDYADLDLDSFAHIDMLPITQENVEAYCAN